MQLIDSRQTDAPPVAAGAPLKVRISGLNHSFTTRGRVTEAVRNVDLSVRDQEFVALVGPSGCGKTTVLNCVAGLIRPTGGIVNYNGQPVTTLNRRIGYLSQKDTLLPWRNVADNVRIALELKCRPTSRREANAKVAAMLELVGLGGFERHYPAELSGGMRKRAALARTLVYEPEALLLDEPFGALDAQLRLIMLDQLQKLTMLRRITVLFVTHDLGEAITLADRVVVFSARPARIRVIREVPLPRPRDVFKVRFDPIFARLNEELWDELKDDVEKGTEI
jgi:NitT/TauT family transport system ATP-binding protein